jgi:hypothetical protein
MPNASLERPGSTGMANQKSASVATLKAIADAFNAHDLDAIMGDLSSAKPAVAAQLCAGADRRLVFARCGCSQLH